MKHSEKNEKEHRKAEHGAAKPVYRPVTCHCNIRLGVRVWVAYKEANPANVGRVFGRCRKPQGQQCLYFEWIDDRDAKLASITAAQRATRRPLQRLEQGCKR